MENIDYIFEPSRLLVVWHQSHADKPRHRRVIGELARVVDNAEFRYLRGTPDFELALAEGFLGFPAFPLKGGPELYKDCLDVFVRRLPPRKREDFKEYLAQYNLPSNFNGSDFALLGYTGARLASDAFELCPDFSNAQAPLDIVIEVSGAQYHAKDIKSVREGAAISFQPEPDNPFDPHAIMIKLEGSKIGYVNKAIAPGFARLLKSGTVEGVILKNVERKNVVILLVLVRYR